MDTAHVKLRPIDPTVAKSVRLLAKSVNAVASQLIADLYASSDIVATIAWSQAELERLAEEAAELANSAHDIERGKVGSG